MTARKALQNKGSGIGQVGFEPTTCRIMRRTARARRVAASERRAGTDADPRASSRTVRLSRFVSRDLDRIAAVLAEHVAMPTHEIAEAADLTVARVLKLLPHLEASGKVRRSEIAGGGSLWSAAHRQEAP